jgi:hypothetical protein
MSIPENEINFGGQFPGKPVKKLPEKRRANVIEFGRGLQFTKTSTLKSTATSLVLSRNFSYLSWHNLSTGNLQPDSEGMSAIFS